MTASPLAAFSVDSAAGASSVSPRRMAVIARKRLQDLGFQSFVVKDLVRGRLAVDPRRLAAWPELDITPQQEFVVQGHDRFWFTMPSPLRFVGPILFYDLRHGGEVLREIESRWEQLCKRSAGFLEIARRYFPNIQLNTETWTLDVDVRDPFGVVNLRVRPYQGTVWVEAVATDGRALAPRGAEDRLIMQLPDEPSMFSDQTLTPLLNRVRSGATPAAQTQEAMILELDIENTSELTVVDGPRGHSASLSLDLESELSADVYTPSEDLELPALDVVEAVSEAPEPIQRRAHRLKTTAVEVHVATARQTVRGIVRDINHGGLFIEVDDPEAFAPNSTVLVSGIGPFATRGTVAHRRLTDEGALLGTGAGIGIAFLDMPIDRFPHGPAPVVVLTDISGGIERPLRFAAIVAAGRCPPILAKDLVQCLVAVRTLPIRAVILDQTFADYGWREFHDALRFNTFGTELIVVTSEAFERFPEGVRAVAPNRLAAYLAGMT